MGEIGRGRDRAEVAARGGGQVDVLPGGPALKSHANNRPARSASVGRASPGHEMQGRVTSYAAAAIRQRADYTSFTDMCASAGRSSATGDPAFRNESDDVSDAEFVSKSGAGAPPRRGRTGGRRTAGFLPPTASGTGSCPVPAACRRYAGIRAGDVVLLTRLLKKSGIDEVYGIAQKEMAPVLLHAAAFEKDITRVALISPSASYRSIISHRIYDPRLVQGIVPGATEVYDLPDLAASLAPRKLIITGESSDEQSVIRSAYQQKHAESHLQIVPDKTTEKIQWWLKD